MREVFNCVLGSKSLNGIDSKIFIEDIRETVQFKFDTEKVPRMGLKLLGGILHESLEITLRVLIKERNRMRRQVVINAINAWAANGGWLTTNIRPSQRIHVVYTQKPSTEALKWSDSIEIAFTAIDMPYWEDIYPVQEQLESGVSGSADLIPRGTRKCYLEANVLNSGNAQIDAFAINANGESISFSGLGLAQGKTMRMYYDDAYYLHAEIDGNSVLEKRTAESADDLLLNPNDANTITYAASGACTVTLIARGLYE